MKNKAFTLIELLVLLAVIGFLIALLIPAFINANASSDIVTVRIFPANCQTYVTKMKRIDVERNVHAPYVIEPVVEKY